MKQGYNAFIKNLKLVLAVGALLLFCAGACYVWQHPAVAQVFKIACALVVVLFVGTLGKEMEVSITDEKHDEA